MMQELNYIHCGDYYIPNIRLPEENRPIGRWGRMHKDYIKEHNPIRFNDLCLSGELWTYLADLNEQAQVGINLKQMIANQKIAATENVEVFGTEKLNTFVSQRTPEGDLLIMRAYTAARDAMKAIYPHLKVGLSRSLHDMQPQRGGEKHAAKEWHAEFGHYLPYIKDDDFIGVQNYTRSRFGFFGQIDLPKGAELTQMSYEFCPEALANVLRAVHKEFKGDIIVTESGIATSDDSRRVEFIRRALDGVHSCIDEGIPVKGYCHWSLLDNFEWQKGFSMTFGLIAVDRKTQTRYPKESLSFLGTYGSKYNLRSRKVHAI